MVKVTTTDFIARAKAVHGDKYDYSVTEYVKSSTKLTIICPVHGEFKVLPSNHVGRRSGCPKCAGQEKLTSESFRERAGEIHGDHYDYSEVQYVNRKTKVTIVCPTHGEFQQTPKAHLTGNGCNKCGWDKLRRKKAMGREEFVSRSREIHSSRYDYHLVEYTNNRTPVTIICPVHGPFEQRPEVHLLGNGCIQCGYESLARWRTKSREQFIADAIAKHGDYYDYSKVHYKHGEQDVTIICPIHGEFQQRPQNHTWGFGCGKCAGNQQLTTEEFIKKARELHGDKYDYSKVAYTRTHNPVTIICPEHGEFKQIPLNHLREHGCPKCHHQRLSFDLRMSKDEFIRKARQAHGDKYDYFKSDYENARKAVVIICPEHGEFKQHPANHMKGVGCPSCASYGFKPNQPALLYYLRIENRVLTFYKIGITNRTVEERFPPQDMAMIQVLKTWEYEKGLDAYAREQEVLAEFAEYRYRGLETVLSSVGNSEFFIKDVLGLDS